MVEQPVEIISVSPYGSGQEDRHRMPANPIAIGLGWLSVVTLAVAASFTRVYSLTISVPGPDGRAADTVRYAVDGWGRTSVAHSAPVNFASSGSPAGARYGALFCLAAAVILLGWLLQSPPMRRRRSAPSGLPTAGLGCVFLAGVVGCQIIATLPAASGAQTAFRFGLSPLLGGSSCVLGLLIWTAQYRTQQIPMLAGQRGR